MKKRLLCTCLIALLFSGLMTIQARHSHALSGEDFYIKPEGIPPDDSIPSSSKAAAKPKGTLRSSRSGHPLKNTNAARVASKKDYSPLISAINSLIAGRQGRYGIYFSSLTNGQSFGIHDNEDYVAASTVKLPINLYLFNQIAERKIDPEETLIYEESDYEEGTGSLQYEAEGSVYSIRELSRRSIVESDNIAINMLIRFLDWDNINAYRESILQHPVHRDENISNPRDMALFLNALLDFGKRYPTLGGELLEYLKNTEFNDRIPLYLPGDVPVAHKIGTQAGAVHDVGIVFSSRPFILSVMSCDVDEEEAPEVIGQIAKLVYDFEQK